MVDFKLEYRMYGLVPYNISPIQQAIQYGHALQEYNNSLFDEFFDDKWKGKKKSDDFYRFQKWANEDKTFIILNGGTTNNNRELGLGTPVGTLNQHCDLLQLKGVKVATFNEPDLNDALTAVVFLVDERVFNKEKYPEWEEWRYQAVKYYDEDTFEPIYPNGMNEYEDWVEFVGGETNVWLREFLSQFRLA